MANLLQIGDVLSLRAGGTCKVEKFLGGGGQGEVYLVRQGGNPYAVKWYFPAYLPKDPQLAHRIETLINDGSVSDKFLWPLDIVTTAMRAGWGYVMPLRPDTYVGITDLEWPEKHPKYIKASYRFLARTCDELVKNLRDLHLKGFCYVDLNPGNVFLKKSGQGDIRICDLDNVCYENDNNAVVDGVLQYMAPEVMLGKVKPSVKSDKHSLSVVLFHIFMQHHPLEGRAIFRYDTYEDAIPEIIGKSPVFIFDERNRSNYALAIGEVPNKQEAVLGGARAIPRWKHLPGYLKDLFTKAFTVGLHDPNARITEGEWRAAFIRLYDSAFPCPVCKNEVVYDPVRLNPDGTSKFICPFRGCHVTLPYRMRLVGNKVIVLIPDTTLYPHHIDQKKPFDFSSPVGQVVVHPAIANKLGLKNLSNLSWKVTYPNGDVATVDSGRGIGIDPNITIDFGPSTGEIRL